MGTVWRLCEYKGVNEGNILPSTPLTHTTTPHTLRDSTYIVMMNKACHWGWIHDTIEGHPHPLSGTLLHLETGNCSNMEFPPLHPVAVNSTACYQHGTHQLKWRRYPNSKSNWGNFLYISGLEHVVIGLVQQWQ